jgi:hypothetical protein
MDKQQISTSTKCVAALVGYLATTAGATPNRLWVLPVEIGLNINTSEFSGAITNYLPIKKAESVLTVPDVILQAKNTLGISKLHLAAVFKMTRQNLDNLLKNDKQKPTQETEARAKQVKKVLDIVSELCPHKLGASTMTCRINERRLFDELAESEINLAQIKIFAQEINKRINAQNKFKIPENILRNQEFTDTFNAV